MNYSLGNTLSRGGSLNADGLSLDLQFATDKTLTARKGPTPTFTRASSGTFVNANGIVVGKTAGTTSSITPSTTTIGSEVTVTVASGSVVGWVVGQAISLVVDTDADDQPDTNELWLLGSIISTTPTTLTFTVTSRTAQAGSTTSWTLGYRGARFDHNPVTLASLGLLMEESRTNLVFPSATLTTQTRTVTAVAHTLSFYGTGTVVLSGTHAATVTGTGAYPTRTTLTFTPTAGSLIMTVTGSVTEAQLEAGAFATSYIPTTTASVVRSADICSITGSDFTGFYNQSEGTIVGSGLTNQPTSNAGTVLFKASDGTDNNRIQFGMTNVTGQAIRPFITASGTTTYSSNQGTASVGVERKIGTAYKTNDAISAFNGTLGTLDTTVTLPTNCNTASLFSGFGTGTISSFRYFKKRLSDAKLQTLTT